MRISFFAPFGKLAQESGLMHLLGTYILSGANQNSGHEVRHLVCNGAYGCCDRDGENGWKRKIGQCASCTHEQRVFADSVGFEEDWLGSFLSPDDFVETARAIDAIPNSELLGLGLAGQPFFPLAEHSLRQRLGTARIDIENLNHAKILRMHYLFVWQALLASKRFRAKVRPDLCLVAGGDEYLSRSLIAELRMAGVLVSTFKWRISERSVTVAHPTSGATFASEFVLTEKGAFRSDIQTWPADIIQIASELAKFLNINDSNRKIAIG